MRSRWIRSIASSGSHLCMNTILAPIASDGIIAAWQPVTWNKGTTINELFWGALGSGEGTGSPRRRKPRAMPKGPHQYRRRAIAAAGCGARSERGFNFPAHRNLRVSEGVENLLG